MNGVGLGALAGGLAQGGLAGYNTAMRWQDQAADRELRARQVGIQEKSAALEQEQAQKEMERRNREEAAHRAAMQVLSDATGFQPDPNTPAGDQIGMGLVKSNALRNPEVLTQVANIYGRAGMPEMTKWLEFGFKAEKEGALSMADALKRGDAQGAVQAFNQSGDVRAKSFEPVLLPDGGQSGKWKVTLQDGKSGEVDPTQLERSVLSPNEWRAMQAEDQKRTLESAKTASTVNLQDAQAEHARGINPTALEIAGMRTDSAEAQTAARLAARGAGGGGKKKGGDEGPDWKEANEQAALSKSIESMVLSNYGDRPNPLDPEKVAHNDRTRRIARTASQLMTQSIKGGNQLPMQDAIEMAANGRGIFTPPKLVGGRLVAEQQLEYNGVIYPLGGAAKPISKDQALQYVETLKSGLQSSGKKVTAEQLAAADDIQALAKQAGMPVDALVRNILGQPAGAGGKQKGLVEPGNIDLTKRKVLDNGDGTISTESSITITETGKDGKDIAVNIPTVIDGKRYSEKEAIDYYLRTGQHLGKFASIPEAEAAAQATHEEQGRRYGAAGGIAGGGGAGGPGAAASGIAPRGPAAERERAMKKRLEAAGAKGGISAAQQEQIDRLKAAQTGEMSRADIETELARTEDAIARLKRTNTGIDRSRGATISNLEKQRDALRAKLQQASTPPATPAARGIGGINRNDMR